MNLKITMLSTHTIWFHWYKNVIIVVQLLSHVRLFATPWTATHQPFLYFTISWSLLKLMSIELVMPSNHLIFCHSLLLLLSIFPSIRVFSNESALCIRCPKYWSSVSASVLPMNIQDWSPLGLSGLISLLSKELSSLLQHHSSKASIHWRSASFMVQLLHLYVTTGNLRGSASPDLFQKWPRLPGSHGSPHLGRSVLRV